MNDRNYHLTSFENAPVSALFDQIVIASVLDCSPAKMERDRWLGEGIIFVKIGRKVRYRKSDVLSWLNQFEPQQSTSESKNVAA